jgi:CRP/FNR family transcriptional regulator, dissimilatory nitrate respiration regulator
MTTTESVYCTTDLAQVPLFEHLSPNDLVRIAAVVRRKRFGRGAMIFLQGQRADGIYVLLDGVVKLYRTSPDGRQQILHIVRPPNAFAEAAVFAGRTFPAHAAAVKPCECLFVPRDELLTLVQTYPELTMRLLASMSLRLQHFVRLIEDLSLREVSARLARYLLEESRRRGRQRFQLPMSKGELSQQLGTTPETLSRTFARLRDQGLVDTSGKTVEVLQVDGLSAILGD